MWMYYARFKAGFSRQIPKGERRSESRQAKGERGIWQRCYWEHFIRDDRDLARHADYTHYNPDYVKRVADWPTSTFRREVKRGVYPVD
jgi:putative transposase